MVTFDAEVSKKTELGYLSPEVAQQRQRTLAALGLQAGERVMDVGCGPGLLAQDMALAVGPGGQVTGFDLSPDMLALAQKRCAGLPQVAFDQGTIEKLPAASDSLDAVACIQVLLYVEDVTRALKEIHRILKPGGRIAVLETDWRGLVINSDDDALLRKIIAGWDSAVASPNLPTRLAPLLRSLGFAAIKTEAIPILSTSYRPDSFSGSTAAWFAHHALEQGLISQAELAGWQDDQAQKARENAYFFCINRFLFSAVKLAA